jgi:hypothetical protein
VGQLGVNAHGEVLVPSPVPDCYLGLRLEPDDNDQAAEVLVVAPAALLHPLVPQPNGTILYELLTGHPDRAPGELVFLADLTVELRAWPCDTWAKVGIDPQAAAAAVVAGWQRGELLGLRLGGLTAKEALALERPAMTYVRAQLGDRLQGQLARASRRWRHPRPATGGQATASCSPAVGSVRGGHWPSGHHRQAAGAPDAPRTLPLCPPAAAARRPVDTLVWTAARVEVLLPLGTPYAAVGVHYRSRRGVHGRSAASDRHVPALRRGAAAVSAAESGRPGQHLAVLSDARRALPRCAVPWTPLGCGPGRRRRQTSTVRTRGQWTRPADTRNLQAAGTVDTHDCGRARGHCGSGPVGQPVAEPSTAACMSGRERERKVRHRPAPPWPDRQIRSLGMAGKPASSWKGSAAQGSRPLR